MKFAQSVVMALFFLSTAFADSSALKLQSSDTVQAVAPKSGFRFSTVADLPIQNGGRLKPLDAFAQDLTIFVTGKKKFQSWDSVELILSWTTHPQSWLQTEMIAVTRPDVRKQLLLDEKRRLFSIQELFRNAALLQYAQTMGSPNPSALVAGGSVTAKDPRSTEIRRVLDRLSIFQALASGEAWTLAPSADAKTPWLPVMSDTSDTIKPWFQKWVTAYRDGNKADFENSGIQLKQAIQRQIPEFNQIHQRPIQIEVLYQRLDPFFWAWVGYLLAALVFWYSVRIGFCFAVPAFCLHLFGFAARVYISGRAPVTNMYESVVWVSLGTILFTMIIWGIQKQRSTILLTIGSSVAAVALIAANSAPAVMDPSIHPLVPVLRSNFWLTIHVLTITLSYAAFALGMGLGNVALFQFLKMSPSVSKIENLNQLAYRTMQFGVVLLAAGTLLGGVWADYSWGRFWGWDPKETWALIALLCYLALLHARFIGWVNAFSYPVWNVCNFLSVVMAWYGVNFVLGVGLHSYGFSSGGFSAVMVGALIQLAYVGLVFLRKMSRSKSKGQ